MNEEPFTLLDSSMTGIEPLNETPGSLDANLFLQATQCKTSCEAQEVRMLFEN